jgi:hypothetical protein
MNGPFLIRIEDAKFADIPNKVVPRTVRLKDPTFESREATEWIFSGYCEKLLYKNEKLCELLQQFLGRLDDPECWNGLTQGQRILYSLAALDSQVKNGGITQFFWNCPDLIFPASDALTALNYPELSVAYEKALEGLIGNKDKWFELRNQSSSDPANFWAPFQATYDLLDLSWFDDTYFEQYGPALIDLLVKYVRDNKAEFIQQ